MLKNKLIAGVLLSGTVLSVASGASAAVTSKPAAVQTTNSQTTTSNAATTSSTTDQTQAKNDRIQTLKEQTMIIRKVIAKDGSLKATVEKSQSSATGASSTSAATTSASISASSSSKADNTGAMGNLTGTAASSASSSSTASSSSATNDGLGVKKDDLKGVNNAKFVVYDVSDLMQTVIKEKLKTEVKDASDQQIDQAIKTAEDQETANATRPTGSTKVATVKEKEQTTPNSSSSSSNSAPSSSTDKESGGKSATSSNTNQTTKASDQANSSSTKNDDKNDELLKQVQELRQNDTLRKEVESRAAKLSKDQLKQVTTVTTGHDNALNADGVARAKLPIDGKYHAYYVVNTETPASEHATNSAPIVVITPVTTDDGYYAPEFTVYPKSDAVPEETTEKKLFQTGHQSWWNQFVDWVQALVK